MYSVLFSGLFYLPQRAQIRTLWIFAVAVSRLDNWIDHRPHAYTWGYMLSPLCGFNKNYNMTVKRSKHVAADLKSVVIN